MNRRALSLLSALAAALATLLPAAGNAQTIPSPYRYVERAQSLGIFGGFLLTDRGERGLGPASAPLLGIRYGGRFAAPVAGVVRLGIAPSEREVFARTGTSEADAPLTPVDEANALIVTGDVGLRLNLTGARTWRSIAPYLQATGGLVSLISSRTESESQLPADQLVSLGPSFAVNVGGGADWFLTERLSLAVATHGHFWRLSTPAGLAGAQRGSTEWTRNASVELGGAFHF